MNAGIRLNHAGLYGIIVAGSIFLFIAALGPGLWGEPMIPWLSWQHKVFNTLCHQDPARSFMINGTSMAVCTRCIGIYGAFMILWLFLPLIAYLVKIPQRFLLRLFGAAIVLNLVDVIGNLFEWWTNTNGSRLMFGILLGGTTALIVINDFYLKKTEE